MRRPVVHSAVTQRVAASLLGYFPKSEL